MEIVVAIFITALAVYWLATRSRPNTPEETWQSPVKNTEADFLTEPIISYSILVADSKTQRLMEVKPPPDYPHHYGILNGQHIELHWNVLNADFISIDGIGYVQSIGKKSFFPDKHSNYKITAKNRNHTAGQEIVIHVFPVPLMEMILTPLPDLTYSKIELTIEPVAVLPKPDVYRFPSLQIPSATTIQKNLTAEKPKLLLLEKNLVQPITQTSEYKSFKTRLFNTLEKQFKNNYKLTDIIQTIRKHYE